MTKIAIDMDGVLVDFVNTAIEIAKEEWDLDLKYEEVREYRFAETVKIKLKETGLKKLLSNQEIYSAIMRKGMFEDLSPMPHAIEAVEKLVEQGHEITILTKALSTNRSGKERKETVDNVVSEKLNWLWKNLGDIPYNVIMVSDMQAKHLVNAHIIVDDDPRVLEHPTALTICVAHPWNEDYRCNQGKMQETIDSMSELPEKVELAESILRTMEEAEEEMLSSMEKELGIEYC